MNFRSETIQKWWPTTQSLDLVEGPVESVATDVHMEVSRFLEGEGIATAWENFPNLDAAFSVGSEFTNVPTIYLVLPTRSKWTVLWNNSLLCDGYDSLCWCLTQNRRYTTIHWSAHDELTTFQPGAGFNHRRFVNGEVIERTVHAIQEDKRWIFYESGQPLPEEDIQAYTLSRKRARLNETGMAALLSRLGASPWVEQFYALPEIQAFVLRRENPPSTIIRRSFTDVIRTANKRVYADARKNTVRR